jgi:hypothetical protein
MIGRAALLSLGLIVAATAWSDAATRPTLFVVHFETGPAWDASKPAAEQPMFREHSTNLKRLRADSLIVFGARYGSLGMIVLRADSLGSARSTVDADPGVRSGTFIYRIEPLLVFYPWRE